MTIETKAATASLPVKTATTSLGAGLLPLPPDVTIPSPPQGYEPTTGAHFRGIAPWTAELVLLPKVLQDLARFAASYTSVLGNTAPPVAQVTEALLVGGQWSSMRSASSAWDLYCRDQEGSAWLLIKGVLDRLRPAFALAVRGDASIATLYPSLAELFGVKKANAAKAASTRKKNAKAEAEGKPATHGGAGKARQKRAEKAALAATTPQAATAAPPPQGAAGASTPVTAKPAGQ
ncbi:MAG TPA: hypothetical protein VGI39_11140 [Polyangiaceae bacterium]